MNVTDAHAMQEALLNMGHEAMVLEAKLRRAGLPFTRAATYLDVARSVLGSAEIHFAVDADLDVDRGELPAGWVIYHRDLLSSLNRASHDGGPWFYRPEDHAADRPPYHSLGHATWYGALSACRNLVERPTPQMETRLRSLKASEP